MKKTSMHLVFLLNVATLACSSLLPILLHYDPLMASIAISGLGSMAIRALWYQGRSTVWIVPRKTRSWFSVINTLNYALVIYFIVYKLFSEAARYHDESGIHLGLWMIALGGTLLIYLTASDLITIRKEQPAAS